MEPISQYNPHFAVQLPLFEQDAVTSAFEKLQNAGKDVRGAVFTRNEVVEFMLDLAGYHFSRPLHELRFLEPSCGEGSFLFPALDRLFSSFRIHVGRMDTEAITLLRDSIRAVELHRSTYEITYGRVVQRICEEGFTLTQAEELASTWLSHGDYLLLQLETDFDFVVGNPPYVRQELIPDTLIKLYRSMFSTIFDRADLYVPFIEKSLRLLKKNGVLAFICPDRWTKNRYGMRLRDFISSYYWLRYYIDMVGTRPFEADVIAYPAITVITRQKNGPTRFITRRSMNKMTLSEISTRLISSTHDVEGIVTYTEKVVNDSDPWIFEAEGKLALVRRLEDRFPLLEEAGCKVGIGVATGADNVYIGLFDSLDVELDRKLPLVTTKDIRSGEVKWKGLGVINPFQDDGNLVDLDDYPKLRAYLLSHENRIRSRNVAKRNASVWYRTIDRIYPELTNLPKLLIPDIKGSPHIVYESGHYYPHHNLYFIISSGWDLRILQMVLMSGIARLFIRAYSPTMRGDFLRFQAQYLRRIRLPRWQDVPNDIRHDLIEAYNSHNGDSCGEAISVLYDLSPDEWALVTEGGFDKNES